MNEQPRANKSKTLTIQSAPKTPTFNLKVGTVSYGVIKQTNVIRTTTVDSKLDLTFSVLTKETIFSLTILKDENITVKWNKIKGNFEIASNSDIVISKKSILTKFSKVFYPVLVGSILVLLLVILFILI